MSAIIRHGDWRSTMAGIVRCDALIADPPYSAVSRRRGPSPRRRSRSLPGAYEAPGEKNGIMVGAKPLGLMRAIVRDYTEAGGLVVDPYAGSGSTAAACLMEGRQCLTSEVDAVTYAHAHKRLDRPHQMGLILETGGGQ